MKTVEFHTSSDVEIGMQCLCIVRESAADYIGLPAQNKTPAFYSMWT